MKKIILRSGLFSTLAMIALFVLTMLIGKSLNYTVQEIAGYAGILLSLLFVYFGIRQYRDQVNKGVWSFGKGMQVGILIVLLPALLFGAVDVVYSTYVNPGFYDDYCSHMLAKLKTSMPPAEYEAKAAEIRGQMQMFKDHPMLQFFVMFMTVFIVGTIITVISSLILRRNRAN